MGLSAWIRRRSRTAVILSTAFAVTAAFPAAIVVDALVRAGLDNHLLDAPTRFYARPLVLFPGLSIDRARVERTLERLAYRETRRWRVQTGEYALGSRTWVIGRRAFRLYDRLDPGQIGTMRLSRDGRISRIEDEDGRRLRHFALEPELLRTTWRASREDRIPVPLADVPQHLVDAVLAIEDHRFFEHHGLDLRRIAAAALANVRARRIAQGASTISQQLAKNLWLSPKRSPVRKVREMLMALLLERRHDKDEILEAYLNQVYLGQDGALAIHGVGRAAQFYFGKDVSQLLLSEAALLAGMIRGPNLYAPLRHPERAIERRDLVLRVMRDQELISSREYRDARRARPRLRERPRRADAGRYFVDYLRRQQREPNGRALLEGGLAVFTTMDMELQRLAETAVRDGLARLERDYPRLAEGNAPLQAALVALRPQTGEILALVGGRDYGASQFNRATRARRQPGSAFKPVVALAALAPRTDNQDDRDPFTLATLLEDEPLAVETPAGTWRPVNYDGRYRGTLTLRDALERSLNVPFARLGLAVGPERIVETAQRLGIESRLYAVPSIALGASEVTPLELTRAFGVLAAQGFRAESQTTLGVVDRYGDLLSQLEVDGEQAYSPAEAYLVTSALRGAVVRGTGRSLRARGYRGPVAAKSGTTNDFRDAWFIGYTPSLVVGVWVGFDDGRSIGIPGSRAALPIFARFLIGTVGRDGEGEFTRPWGLEVVEVDRETGLRAGPGCRGEPELFLRGTAPRESCSPYWPFPRGMSDRRSSWHEEIAPLIYEFRRRLDGNRD